MNLYQKFLELVAWIKNLLNSQTTTTTTPTIISSTTTTTTVNPNPTEAWPSYRFDTYFGHGYSSENDDRTNAINACKAAGLTCIRCNGLKTPNDELAVHLLHFRSPVDHEFKLGSKNWYNQALAKGVSRYQIVIDSSGANRWSKLVVDYPENTVQFLVSSSEVQEVKTIITQRPVITLIE